MFKWIKSLFRLDSEDDKSLIDQILYNALSDIKTSMSKGGDISEPVISFVEIVRKYPKRFDVYSDSCVIYTFMLTKEREYSFYSIRDVELNRGWFIKGDRYKDYYTINAFKNILCHEHAFFLTEDEEEYLVKEISSIMEYRIARKRKLDKIRADRRIRDTRNKIKELYK